MEHKLIKYKNNNKKNAIFLILTIIMFLGISLGAIYYIYHIQDERDNELTTGLVSVEFTETGNITLTNTVPMSDAQGLENDAYEFTVKNTSKVPINMNLQLEIDNNNNTLPVEAVRYGFYVNNKLIIKDSLANIDENGNFYVYENFPVNETLNCKLVFWVDYYYENSGESFSGKIKVVGESFDIIYETPATETIKANLVSYATSTATNFTGGLVGINTTGTLYNETTNEQIREYRYSGADVDNYIYYNCADTAGGKSYGDEDYDYASNCQVWRIVGIFEENGEEYLKIMNNNTLTNIPTTYAIDDTTYTIGNGGTTAYWNKYGNNYTEPNNWPTAGLQYYLNTEYDESGTPVAGYLSALSTNAKNLIRETIYYLGNVDYNVSTVKLSYEQERDENRKWSGNKSTWIGKLGLLYPSDYGYSASNLYWETDMYGWGEVESDGVKASSTSWMQIANHSSFEWFLSPSSNDATSTIRWSLNGGLNNVNVYSLYIVRPVLNLKFETKVLKGNGDVNSPYVVIAQ